MGDIGKRIGHFADPTFLFGKAKDVAMPGQGAAKRARFQQEQQIAKQRQVEQARLAESTGEVAKRRALAQRPGGRSLLVATSPRGVQTLGGT